MHLGLPVIAFIAICYLCVGERGFATQRQWMLASIALICSDDVCCGIESCDVSAVKEATPHAKSKQGAVAGGKESAA